MYNSKPGDSMTSMSSEEFLTEVVKGFRKEFEKFAPDEQRLIKASCDGIPFEPCQIEVLDFGAGKPVIWILIHDNQLPDMTFKIHKDAKSLQESEFIRKCDKNIANVLFDNYEKILSGGDLFIILSKRMLQFFEDYATVQETIEEFIEIAKIALKEGHLDSIEHNTNRLRESITRIPEESIRKEILSITRKIDTSLREIKRLDEEIDKVRRLVGASREYQDWRVLVLSLIHI